MTFHCPWGCPNGTEHENAWECPKFAQKFLGAIQALSQKLDREDH